MILDLRLYQAFHQKKFGALKASLVTLIYVFVLFFAYLQVKFNVLEMGFWYLFKGNIFNYFNLNENDRIAFFANNFAMLSYIKTGMIVFYILFYLYLIFVVSRFVNKYWYYCHIGLEMIIFGLFLGLIIKTESAFTFIYLDPEVVYYFILCFLFQSFIYFFHFRFNWDRKMDIREKSWYKDMYRYLIFVFTFFIFVLILFWVQKDLTINISNTTNKDIIEYVKYFNIDISKDIKLWANILMLVATVLFTTIILSEIFIFFASIKSITLKKQRRFKSNYLIDNIKHKKICQLIKAVNTHNYKKIRKMIYDDNMFLIENVYNHQLSDLSNIFNKFQTLSERIKYYTVDADRVYMNVGEAIVNDDTNWEKAFTPTNK